MDCKYLNLLYTIKYTDIHLNNTSGKHVNAMANKHISAQCYPHKQYKLVLSNHLIMINRI